jgi:hypothetical protein
MNSLYQNPNFVFRIINDPGTVEFDSKFIVIPIDGGVKIIDIAVIVIILVAIINILIIILNFVFSTNRLEMATRKASSTEEEKEYVKIK